MRTVQKATILVFIASFFALYFGCDTKSKKHIELEKSRSENIELIDIDGYIRETKHQLSAAARDEILVIENNITQSDIDADIIENYKTLASLWYGRGHPLISGFYAEQVAKKMDTGQSWSIAGTTYALFLQDNKDPDEMRRKYAAQKSRAAYGNAIEIDSSNIDSKINLALSYVDMPVEDNPMKGILMLVDLSKKHPENPSVLFQLGRLALGTNQIEKAVSRLTQAISVRPDYREAHCLLAVAYNKLGDTVKAEKAQQNCDSN